jgi:hypothetical protein
MVCRVRVLLSAALLAAVALCAALTDLTNRSARVRPTEKDMPSRLARHLERLREALPGTGGLAAEGPASFADEQFLQRAYPGDDIPLTRLSGAVSAFNVANRRNFPKGNKTGAWVSVGPTTALYQRTPFRTSDSYVPNEFAAGGRTTALAIGPSCTADKCRLYAAAAGGGVWRTDNALAANPRWTFLSPGFALNAIGALAVDPNDPTGDTILAGTGEANACGVCGAGAGLYRSTDGGQSWAGPLGASVFGGRAIGTIAVDPTNPNVLYVGTTRGVRGVSSVTGGAVSLIPGAAKWGLYKSIDGGATWTFIHNGAATTAGCTGDSNESGGNTPCSPRGVRKVALDPSNPQIVYAGSYQRGVWRSMDGGASWVGILAPISAGPAVSNTERAEFALTTLPNGKTRMYVGVGSLGPPLAPPARFLRSDDVTAAAPTFVELSSPDPALPGYGSYNYCTGQCWYDQIVVTPAGHPDIVYLGGSYLYGETGGISNGRAVVLSTDAGVSWSDLTMDATDVTHPNGLHPDEHSLVLNPSNPFQFFQASDGGVVRSSGEFADMSSSCAPRELGLTAGARCRQLLSRVPTRIDSINVGYRTLQFMSLSVNPADSTNLQGGTQDNGTWETTGDRRTWLQTMWGDGGQSGFDIGNPLFRFHTFFQATPDVNFSAGAIHDWNWVGDRLFGVEPQAFYIPIISDPTVSGSIFAGLSHVWRTKTFGMGSMTLEEFRGHCNEFTGDFAAQCGDFEPLGADVYLGVDAPSQESRLTDVKYGTDRTGGTVAAVERAPGDTSTLWAATSTGRVFVSKNADAEPAGAVIFSRIDNTASNDPNRFVSGIAIDAQNPNRAWLTYSGFSASTPAAPGHIFEVVFDPVSRSATWTSLDHGLGDVPLTDVVRDINGDLYVSTDYGVLALAAGATAWTQAAPGLPTVMVAGLTIVPADRKLYAATHGLGAWLLNLP